MRTKTVNEYRINKKGAECFRTRDLEECMSRLAELNAKRPVYTMQRRWKYVDSHGMTYLDWSNWMD